MPSKGVSMHIEILAHPWPCDECHRVVPALLGILLERLDLRTVYCLICWRKYIYREYGIRYKRDWKPLHLMQFVAWKDMA